MEFLRQLVPSEGYEPHGQCLLWDSGLLALHAVSDVLTTSAYYVIAFGLVYFARKRQDVPFNWMFLLFGAFFVSCGTTHLLSAWTIWKPSYWLDGGIKGI